MMYGQDYEDALEMVQYSEHHRNWSDEMIQNYIEKPLGIRQYKIMRDDLHEPVMFATWAFPSDEQVDEYVGTKYFPVDGSFPPRWLKTMKFVPKSGPASKSVKLRCFSSGFNTG